MDNGGDGNFSQQRASGLDRMRGLCFLVKFHLQQVVNQHTSNTNRMILMIWLRVQNQMSGSGILLLREQDQEGITNSFILSMS